MILRHLKSRNGECRDVRLQFDKPHQSFTLLDGGESTSTTNREPRGKLQAAIADLWGRTAAAADDAGDEWEANR